jgi:hypothetical protein
LVDPGSASLFRDTSCCIKSFSTVQGRNRPQINAPIRRNFHFGIPVAIAVWAGISFFHPRKLYEAEMAFAVTLALTSPLAYSLPSLGYIVFIWLFAISNEYTHLELISRKRPSSAIHFPPMTTLWLQLREWGWIPGFNRLPIVTLRYPHELWVPRRVWLFENIHTRQQQYFDCANVAWEATEKPVSVPFALGRIGHGGEEYQPSKELSGIGEEGMYDPSTATVTWRRKHDPNTVHSVYRKVLPTGSIYWLPVVMENHLRWCEVEIVHEGDNSQVHVQAVNTPHGVGFEGKLAVSRKQLRTKKGL